MPWKNDSATAWPEFPVAISQIAAAIGHQRESGFVLALGLVASLKASTLDVDDDGLVMEAGHHPFEVVAVERVEDR